MDSTAEFHGNAQLRGGTVHVVANPHRLSQIDLAFVASALRRQARLIGLVFVVGLAVTLFVLMIATPRYTATATILIDVGSAKGTGMAISEANSDVIIQDEVEILRSRRIATRVLKELEVPGADPSAESGSRTSSLWPSFVGLKPQMVQVANATGGESGQPPAGKASADASKQVSLVTLNRLMSSVDIQRKGRSNIVDVTCSASNGERAAAVANAFIKAYLADQLEVKYEAARSEHHRLKTRIQEVSKGIDEIEQRQQAYGKLPGFARDLDFSTKLYGTLLSRYHETGATPTPDAHVISFAVVPTRPTSPRKTLLLLLASVAWLGVGAGLGLMRELSHRPLRSRAESERVLGLPCVAELPVVDVIDPASDEGDDGAANNLCTPIHWKLPEQDEECFSQAIFVLRQWTESISERGPRVVLFTAAHRGEGCSTVAAQLARYATSTGVRTALVDADLRNRGLTKALGIEASTSFTESVLDKAAPKPPVAQLQDGIGFCAAPRGDCRPLDVLGSHRMHAFLDGLRDDYDLIVIDTPPLATYIDAAALVEYVDGILVVIKAGQTEQQDVIDALNRLDADPQLPIGVVLNMVGQTSKR
jgi:capsular exopolysaccharide synthesis family protein